MSQSSKYSVDLAIIGGSGLYAMDSVELIESLDIATPFGRPSDNIQIVKIDDKYVAFLARHGQGHRLSPSTINYQANLAALKILGVTQILAVSAVGSLKAEIEPGHFVIVDQFIDRTYKRKNTIFDTGYVAHVNFAEPCCPELRNRLNQACKDESIIRHERGTYLCMEGPAFSTRAESLMHQQMGADIVGMTNATEAKLAREMAICYASLSLSTDYDCWHPDHDSVTSEMVLATLKNNVKNVQRVLLSLIQSYEVLKNCKCRDAVKNACLTHKDFRDPHLEKMLEFINPSRQRKS